MEYSKLLTTTWSSLEKINIYDTPLSLVILWLSLSLVTFVIAKPALAFLEQRLQRFAQSTTTTLDDRIHDYFEATHSLFLICCALYCVKLFIPLGTRVTARIDSIALLGALLQAGIWLQLGYSQTLTRVLERSNQHSAHGLLLTVGRFILWIFLFLIFLSNFGIDVSALLTGLGIGGIAIALAVQAVLSDLLASLAIVLDKPFEVGDFIITGDILGSVEKIGLKTTRIRSLSGEQWVLPNSDLVGSRVRNFKRMDERRVVMKIGVTYQTPPAKVKLIPEIIKEIICAQSQVRFDRVHFSEYTPSSLEYEIVFYMLTPDYNTFMDVKQSINYTMLEKFKAEGVEFAYPTQTLHVHQSSNQASAREHL